MGDITHLENTLDIKWKKLGESAFEQAVKQVAKPHPVNSLKEKKQKKKKS